MPENTKASSSKKNRKLPTVVLVGRPNVGKSTLFNRLLRKRRTITDPTPGVTRDPIEADALINGKPVRLIDTGGFKLDRITGNKKAENTNSIDDLVVEKTLSTVEKASLIVLLLEAGEITSEDEEFIRILRPYRERLIVAVNKTEGGRREADAWNLLSFGFDKVFMISAEHGDNIGELTEEIIKRIDFSRVEAGDEVGEHRPIKGSALRCPHSLGHVRASTDATSLRSSIRITILGKPNTGKSTLSNRLTSSNASIVSEIPGTTRDVI